MQDYSNMEFRDERERFENHTLGRECEAALYVAALQGFLLNQENEDER